MKRLTQGQIGIEQGSRVLFSDYADGGLMWTGRDDRESCQPIVFNEPYLVAPSVMVSISMWDIDHKHNARADISAQRITTKGFDLIFRTWGDTRLARVRADWLAIGAVQGDEDWDLG